MAPKPKGKYKGVPFYVVSTTWLVGRRQPFHSLPFQDNGVVSSDLGREPIEVKIDALVLGDDVRDQRDALLDVFQESGAGMLYTPDTGRINMLPVGKPRIRQTTTELRAARVSMHFIEHVDDAPQLDDLDVGSALQNAARKGRVDVSNSFENPNTGLKIDVSGLVDATNLSVLDDALQGMRAINGAVSSVLAAPGNLAAQIDAVSREVAFLLDSPSRLMASFDGAFELLAAAVNRVFTGGTEIDQADAVAVASLPLRRGRTGFQAATEMLTLGEGVPDVPDIDTPERDDQRDSQLAIQRHMQASALLNLADVITDTPFDSADDALDMRDLLANGLADLAESEPDLDAELAKSLKSTASLVAQHLTNVAGRLPDVVDHTPAMTLPAEVIAFGLYGDPERAEEIVQRNPLIRHAGGVPGGVTIKVESA